MYNVYDWLRSCVFVYMFPTLNVMGHGSHVRWVNGSWVNSNDPLPMLWFVAFCSRTACSTRIVVIRYLRPLRQRHTISIIKGNSRHPCDMHSMYSYLTGCHTSWCRIHPHSVWIISRPIRLVCVAKLTWRRLYSHQWRILLTHVSIFISFHAIIFRTSHGRGASQTGAKTEFNAK